jgi:hypothetical protein
MVVGVGGGVGVGVGVSGSGSGSVSVSVFLAWMWLIVGLALVGQLANGFVVLPSPSRSLALHRTLSSHQFTATTPLIHPQRFTLPYCSSFRLSCALPAIPGAPITESESIEFASSDTDFELGGFKHTTIKRIAVVDCPGIPAGRLGKFRIESRLHRDDISAFMDQYKAEMKKKKVVFKGTALITMHFVS